MVLVLGLLSVPPSQGRSLLSPSFFFYFCVLSFYFTSQSPAPLLKEPVHLSVPSPPPPPPRNIMLSSGCYLMLLFIFIPKCSPIILMSSSLTDVPIVPSIIERKVLKSQTIILQMSIFPYYFWFMYFEAVIRCLNV